MGPVKPGLPVRTLTLILKKHLLEITSNFGRSLMKLRSSFFICGTSIFILHLWNFGAHGLLPGVYPSVVRPIILRLEEQAADLVIGVPSPGALENPPGLSRIMSLVAKTGEPGPGSGPNTSGASSSNI